jgi:hypothetical protein
MIDFETWLAQKATKDCKACLVRDSGENFSEIHEQLYAEEILMREGR